MLRPLRFLVPICVLAFLHGLLFVIAIPPWDLYDEGTHLAYALVLRDERRIPHLEETTRDDVARSEIETDRWARFRLGRPDTSSLEAMGLGGRLYQGYQPPLYYALVIPPTYLGRDVLGVMYAARMVGPVLLVILTVVTWMLARVWFPERGPWLAVSAATSIALTPAAASAAGRVNNDLLAALLIASGVLALSRFVRDPSYRIAALSGVLAAAAVLTKTHGVMLLALAGVALIAILRTGGLQPGIALTALAPGVVAFGIWTAWTFHRYGTLTGTEAFLQFARPFEPLSMTSFLETLLFSTWSSYWVTYDGGAIERWTGLGLFIVVFIGMVGLIWRRAVPGDVAALSIVAGGTMLVMLWYGNVTGLVLPQGRVLLPILPLGAVLVAAGWSWIGPRWLIFVPPGAAVLGSLAFLFGWFFPFFY